MAKKETNEENVVEEKMNTEEESKDESGESNQEISSKKEKSFERKEEIAGIVYIHSSPNNTIVHITDLSGNTISRVSGGMVTKHSRLKSSPTIAMFVAKKAAERAKDLGINALYVRMRGKTEIGSTGPGAHAAVKSLGKEGFRIVNVLDTTRYPRGGPKKKGGKRGRRV